MEIQGNELRIICPPGMEIDKENSTFECIKFEPIVKRWRDTNSIVEGFRVAGNGVFHYPKVDTWDFGNHNLYATEKQAKSALAMAQISQIMANDKRFGGVITDEEWEDINIDKFLIIRVKNTIFPATNTASYGFLSFHTKEQRDLFLKENEDLVKDYLMVD